MLWILVATLASAPCQQKIAALLDLYGPCLQGCPAFEDSESHTKFAPAPDECAETIHILQKLGAQCCPAKARL